jgi:DNA polymerase-1
VALALWLVDSNITDPSLEDVFNFTETKDWNEAKKKILEELDWRDANKVYEEIELPLMPILERMQKKGIKIDKKILNDLSVRYHKELIELEKKIWSLAGTGFNVSSPKQIGEILFQRLNIAQKGIKKTAGGAISTKESELEKLRDTHPIVGLILDYRERAKLVNTYIDTIPNLLDKENRLHPRLVQSGTATGRMSSEDPNIQNIPIRSDLGKAIRNAFIAEKDFSLLSLDYSQIELRVAGFLSKDKELIEIFKSGRDVHTEVASRVFKVASSQVDPEMRRRAKIINFGVMYGMGVNALRANLGGTRAEAQDFYNKYFETFSGLSKYLEDTKESAKKNGYTQTFFGRRRYIRGLDSTISYVIGAAERVAINAPIQGTEADIVKLAMVRIEKYLKEKGLEEKAFMIMQIHDEIVLEVKDEIAKNIAEEISKIMRNILSLEETEGIPLAVSYHIGKDWGK